MKKCVIIGSGLSGLATGVVLSRNGYNVTILEQSDQIGGCLQCFKRGNAKFETGMHYVGSLNNGEVLSNYFNFWGIKEKIDISSLDTSAYDIVKLNGELFRFPNGHEAMIDSFGKLFPKEKDNLVRYWQLIDKVAETTPYYQLNKNRHFSIEDNHLYTSSINEILDNIFDEPLLKDVLMGNIMLYAARRNRTPFSLHASINDLYNRSAFRIVGGSDNISAALSDEIKKTGGTIKVQSRAIRAICKNGELSELVLSNGESIQGDIFISSIHPSVMTDLFVDNEIKPAYVSRIKSIPNTISVFAVYLKFRPETVPYNNSNYFVCNNRTPWDLENYTEETWPIGYLYMHSCHTHNPKYASTGVIFAYMSANDLSRWSDTRIGHRCHEYEIFKKEKAFRLLSIVEKDFPGINANIESFYTATPLTYRDYTLNPGGSMYGMAKDITLGTRGRIPFRTKIPNLFLVGQNIMSHGILGVLAGTIKVCAAILGDDKINREIQERNFFSSTSTT